MLIEKPTNTDIETLDKPWDIGIVILLNIPHKFKLKIAINGGFECKMEEKR